MNTRNTLFLGFAFAAVSAFVACSSANSSTDTSGDTGAGPTGGGLGSDCTTLKACCDKLKDGDANKSTCETTLTSFMNAEAQTPANASQYEAMCAQALPGFMTLCSGAGAGGAGPGPGAGGAGPVGQGGAAGPVGQGGAAGPVGQGGAAGPVGQGGAAGPVGQGGAAGPVGAGGHAGATQGPGPGTGGNTQGPGAGGNPGTGGQAFGAGGNPQGPQGPGAGGNPQGPGAGGSNTMGCGLMASDPTCDACLTQNCCAEETACSNDVTCTDCLGANPGPMCNQMGAAFTGLNACFGNSCSTQCAGGGTGGSGAGGSGTMSCGFTTNNPTCDACINGMCCAQAMACHSDATCLMCVTSMTPPASCDTNTLQTDFLGCVNNSCGTACM